MYNHAPENYVCPFCLLIDGIENDIGLSVQSDIVLQDVAVTALISAYQHPNNHGHVIVIPNDHFENIYDLPAALGARIYEAAKEIALAMKSEYACDGVSTRQHNEPAGNQDVWHYHLHVIPRYTGDKLYASRSTYMEPEERALFARKLLDRLNLH